MASERIQRQIDRLLDEAAEAVAQGDWELVRDCSQKVLVVEPENQEALTFMAIAERLGFKKLLPLSELRSHQLQLQPQRQTNLRPSPTAGTK